VVVGARRARQGIGQYVTNALAVAGCEIAAVVGTTPETVQQAAEPLGTRGYTDVQEAIARERPDLVALCTPIETHREQLSIVAAAGCHCLCEKPLLWDASRDNVLDATAIVAEFEHAGAHLGLITQWPQTLTAFFLLHPAVEDQPVETFAMHLGPISTGAQMVLDSVSHPLSMLERLCGDHDVEKVLVDREERRCTLRFSYGGVDCRIDLETCEEPPRPAGYSINGLSAERRVQSGPEYRLWLEDGDRSVSMEDPLPLQVRSFLQAARTDSEGLLLGMRNLTRLMRAVE
jgi:hypothetical protein